MNELARSSPPPESFGRYLLYPAIARGGMATVHTARLMAAEGFTRLVAAKRLHPELAEDPDFVTMFHDEACIASRIHHPNVVPVLDVVISDNELILVQEYVHGVPLSRLMKVANSEDSPIPTDIVIAVLSGVLAGLHAAHEVKDEQDRPLEIVHRDVSPANVMVSIDGIPRLLDFGIAKARTSTHHTREGVFKGKLAYMAPEQLRMDHIDRTIDVYAAGVLAWEMLVNRRVYDGRHELQFVQAVVGGEIPSLTAALADEREKMGEARWKDIVALEPIVSRAMAPEYADRYATAADMQRAVLDVAPSATSMVVAEWVRSTGAEFLEQRQKALAASEESSRRTSLYFPTSGSMPVGATSTAPTSVTCAPSGAYRVTRPMIPIETRAQLLARPRLLRIVAAGALAVASLVIGFLCMAPGAPTTTMTVVPTTTRAAAGPDLAITVAPPLGTTFVPTIIASAPGPSPAASVVPVTPLSLAPAAAPAPRPAPPPPRWTPPPPAPRPTPPAASTPASASASKTDCNPPFFFEGTKKVFKPSCL